MSLLHFSSAVDSIPNGHDPRLSTKRKLDDYGPSFEEDGDESSLTHRMRKDDHHHHHPHHHHSNHSINDARSSAAGRAPDLASDSYDYAASSSDASPSAVVYSSSHLQFFIRMLSGGKTIVVHANSEDKVQSIHERLQAMTGIPAFEQRLIYRGKQLQWEQSLAECKIQNDAGLQLVGRMRSTNHPQAWQAIDDMITAIRRLCGARGDPAPVDLQLVKEGVQKFLNLVPKENEIAPSHLQIFMASSAPAFLVMLYMSLFAENKKCADTSITYFLTTCKSALSKYLHSYCAPMVLEFCKLLRKVSREDKLYRLCRSTYAFLLDSANSNGGLKQVRDGEAVFVLQEIFPFVSEIAEKLLKDLKSSMEPAAGMETGLGPTSTDVSDFALFMGPLQTSICQAGFKTPICIQAPTRANGNAVYVKEIDFLYAIFENLLNKMDECLARVEECLVRIANGEPESAFTGWYQYLAILKELSGISKLYKGAEERLWVVLSRRKSALCALIVKYGRRNEVDSRYNQWLLDHKDVLNFEARRHLAMMLFPEVKEDYEELHEMLIDRFNLLEESFAYITRAEPSNLHAGLFMEFKNEEATGPGVLREWFFLVCQAICNPEIGLFVPCPNDRRRFFPNPASKVNPLHLDYFNFAGRVIALALMHKVQVGIVFDRVFFLQLAGKRICLEDIKEADPCLYSSCKQILEMDAEFIDSDALGLAFIREVEELGSRNVIELCPGGKSISVNSRNRKEYVDYLIQDRFVTSVSQQVAHFAKGFVDILADPKNREYFFQSLYLEDLDWMLHGSGSAISVDDWKACTEYNGFNENDPQITWFWKIVGEISPEQRKVLLFFWTSVKYLPIEGFRGLASKLHIYKSIEPDNRLPSSHTCFYRLCFPPYSSMAVMKDRLNVITQEHVGCSFGTW